MSTHLGDLRRNTIRQLESISIKLEAQSAKWEGSDNFFAGELLQLVAKVENVTKDLKSDQRKRQKRR